MEELEKKRAELEKQLKRMQDTHSKKYSQTFRNEGAYRDSAQAMKALYDELFNVCLELGDPIPVWF